MMKRKLRIAVSPLTNTIFAGKILKEGYWSSGKQDVTMDCLISVAEHVKKFGKPVEITDDNGKLIYKITVEFYKDLKEIVNETATDRTKVVKQILEIISNYGELDAQPADEYEVNLDQLCRALHGQIKKKFLL